jgi:hypothetical protein
LEYLEGHGISANADGRKPDSIKKGRAFSVGDEIRMENDSHAVMAWGSSTAVWLGPGTRLKILRMASHPGKGYRLKLQLLEGRLLAKTGGKTGEREFVEVETAGLTVAVRDALLELGWADGDFQATLGAGEAEVTTPGRMEKVAAGYSAVFQGGVLRLKRRLDRSEKVRFDRWKNLSDDLLQKRLKRFREARGNESEHREKPKKR